MATVPDDLLTELAGARDKAGRARVRMTRSQWLAFTRLFDAIDHVLDETGN